MFLRTCFFQRKAIDSYKTNGAYFPSRLELVQAITQNFQLCSNVGCTNGCCQGFFFYGQLISFFYGLLGRILSRVFLPPKEDWEIVHELDFYGKILLGLTDFMRKTQFRLSVLRVA